MLSRTSALQTADMGTAEILSACVSVAMQVVQDEGYVCYADAMQLHMRTFDNFSLSLNHVGTLPPLVMIHNAAVVPACSTAPMVL